MKRLFVAGIAAVAFCGAPALAADMPTKAAPAAVYGWTGAYWGLNAGYGKHDATVSFSPTGGEAAGFFITNYAAPVSFNSSGFVGGGQIGYNWQHRNWVTGIEADLDFSDVKGRGSMPRVNGELITNASQKLEWLSTLRVRFGLLATERFLIFSTGGLAVGNRRGAASVTYVGPAPAFGFAGPDGTGFLCTQGIPCVSGNQSKVAVGWTLGGGIEWAVSNNISFKMEYLYINLGDQNVEMAFASPSGTPTPGLVGKLSDGGVNIVRVGFNVKY